MSDPGIVRAETYPCEPYRWGRGRGNVFNYRMGYRAFIGWRDLGIYPSRKAAEKALVAREPTPEAIEATIPVLLAPSRLCAICGKSIRPRGMGPHVLRAHREKGN